jgi:small subunit ribosomal protein S8
MNSFCNLTSQLKNAIKSNQKFVYFPKTSFTSYFLKILFLEGFVSCVAENHSGRKLKVSLKYNFQGTPVFKEIKNFSVPSKNYYLSYSQLAKMSGGFGTFIISTNEGLLTNHHCIKRKLGGTLLCSIL